MKEDRNSEGQRIAPRLRETLQRSDKLLTTLRAVALRAQNCEAFLAAAITKPSPGPLSAGIEGFTPKIELGSVSLTTYVNRWSASEYSWCPHSAIPLQNHRPSGPQHEQA